MYIPSIKIICTNWYNGWVKPRCGAQRSNVNCNAVLCRIPLLRICMCLLGIEASHPRYQHEQDDKESVNCRDVLDRPLKTNQQSLDE